jgi:hypothetical protein
VDMSNMFIMKENSSPFPKIILLFPLDGVMVSS